MFPHRWATRLAAGLIAGLIMASALAVMPAASQPDPRYQQRQPSSRQLPPRQAAPGEVIYLAPPVRGQRPPPSVRVPPVPQTGFRIPFLDRLFGGSGQVLTPQQQPSGATVAAPSAQPERTAVQPPRPKVEPKYFVAVAGDELAEALAGGLEEALSDRPDIAVIRSVTAGKGIIGRDPSMAQSLREFIGSRKKVDAVIVATGLGDQAPLSEGKAEHAFRTTRWNQIFAMRVDEVLIALTERRLPVVWLGLPPVADEERAGGNAHINEILRQRLIGFGASFHDVWAGFVDDEEAFAAVGPSLDGRNVRLRLADGVGFTRSGARKYAHYAEIEIRRLFPLGKGGEDAGVIAKASDPSIHVITAAPRTAGATLLSADLPAIPRGRGSGDGPAPTGRADDFRWTPAN